MIEVFDTIATLGDQISALLDLMQMADASTDMKSINTTSEMCLTMFTELQREVDKLEKGWRENHEQ